MEEKDSAVSIQSLLADISEVTNSVLLVEMERNNFIEIGSYLYRTSSVLMELQINKNTPTNVAEILLSLWKSFELAEHTIKKQRRSFHMEEELQGVVKDLGKGLSLMPFSAFGERDYAGITAKSLSMEIKEFSKFQRDPKTLGSAKNELERTEMGKTETDLYSLDADVSLENLQMLDDETYLYFSDKSSISTNSTTDQWNDRTWRIIHPGVALKATTDEQKDTNEAVRIKMVCKALFAAKTQDNILDAIEDLRIVCRREPCIKVQVCSIGMITLLAKFLDYKNITIQCVTLELLRELAEENNDRKDMITKEIGIATIIRMLSSNYSPVKHASAALLLVLSECKYFCDIIEEVSGAILMLITAKNKQDDKITSEVADKVLKSLERSSLNVRHMAETGHWEPLMNYLNEGTEEMKMEMASYIGEIVLTPEKSTYVAKRSSPALIKMLQTNNTLSRNAAFKALEQISLHQMSSNVLVEDGIISVMIEEIFNGMTIYKEPTGSKKEATGILANILQFGVQLANHQVKVNGHRMDSEYTVYRIIHMIKKSNPDELNCNLIRILQCLMRFPNASPIIVSGIKETEAGYILIEFINYSNDELSVASIKFLITLSPLMGNTLSERICKNKGQTLIRLIQPSSGDDEGIVTETQAVSANLLAKLPHQDLTLNLALIEGKTVHTIIDHIEKLNNSGARTGRHVHTYFEGLVGILARFTSTLYDHRILQLVKMHNFTSLFMELLIKTSSGEIKKISATALGNMSKESVSLSKPPFSKRTKYLKNSPVKRFISLYSSKQEKVTLCPIHRGMCSSRETFCLVDAKAVERLLACLENKNVEVVEASLSALSTLLDDQVDIDKSAILLTEKQSIKHVINVVKEHREEAVRHKSFWIIEKILSKRAAEPVSDISQDKFFHATLIDALHCGDVLSREMAEKILMHLKRTPQITTPSSPCKPFMHIS